VSPSSTRILVIEDDATIRDNLCELLDAEGYDVCVAAEGKRGLALALQQRPDLVLCDIMMPVMDGYQVLRRLRDYPPTADVPFVFLTAKADAADRSEGMRLGADDYITKPYGRRDLLDRVAARLARFRVARAATAPEATAVDDGEPVVVSPAMQRLMDQAKQLALTPLSVLILGETGVGKDVVAHAIHRASPRRASPFVPLHAASLSESLIESELFGHERGAFTGAARSRQGVFEAADGGTVFLDEIGELQPELQVKLLRVLEDRKVVRVGGGTAHPVDVRFVAATNRDLKQAVRDGRFREDLYYRLAGAVLEVPPLRDRLEAVPQLAERFARLFARQCERPAPALADAAVATLQAHDWPGNVRELRNTVERAVALCAGDVIEEVSVSTGRLRQRGRATSAEGSGTATTLQDEVKGLERKRIVEALERHGGNQTHAARDLGIARRTLINRMDDYGLPRPRKKG